MSNTFKVTYEDGSEVWFVSDSLESAVAKASFETACGAVAIIEVVKGGVL